MDNPQPNDPNVINYGNIATYMATSFIAAATIALRKATTIKVAAYHILLATLLGPCGALFTLWMWPNLPLFTGLVICIGVGLTIFAWAVQVERLNKRVEDADVAQILRDKTIGKLPDIPADTDKEKKP